MQRLPWAGRGQPGGSDHDPIGFLGAVVTGLMVAGAVVALVLWAAGIASRALTLAGVLWALAAASAWGFGLLGSALDSIARVLQGVGLRRAVGFSEVEALLARGEVARAADAYAVRARDPDARVEATCRRAVLLAGPLSAPALAHAELELLRTTPLAAADDRRVGTLLAELHAHVLDDPGRAMAELRRLLDTHPAAPESARWRRLLAELKAGGRP